MYVERHRPPYARVFESHLHTVVNFQCRLRLRGIVIGTYPGR